MAKFKFRLATFLRLRESQRDQRRGELAEVYRADEKIERQQQEIDAGLLELSEKYRQASAPGPVDVRSLVASQRFETLLRDRRRHLHEQRETLAAEIERRREQLVAANREVRVLEKLEQRLLERHCQDADREEVKVLDEVAATVRLLKRASH